MALPVDPPAPLQRLIVHDGLLLNAHRWQQAHEYHRQRQNIHYQALHQPGIVYGLGVRVIAAPEEIAAQYRDGRWVEVQPGMAIDRQGNPIIVDRAIAFHFSATAREAPVKVYLVLSYVDPAMLQSQSTEEMVRETFRIDEKTTPASGLEVELCRIELSPGGMTLSASEDVFSPQPNQLDLRYRRQVGARSQGIVQVAYLAQGNESDQAIENNLSCLLQAFLALDPERRGIESVIPITPQSPLPSEDSGERWAENQALSWQEYDFIYLSYAQAVQSNPEQQLSWCSYLAAGGVLLIELWEDQTQIDELSAVQQELEEAIADIGDTAELQVVKAQLREELAACEVELNRQIEEICASIQSLGLNLGMTTGDSGRLFPWHPLKNQPFLFQILPQIRRYPIRVFHWGGIILVIGDLSLAWGVNGGLELPREKIRNAHEFGINLLHFASRRRQLTQLQQSRPLAIGKTDETVAQ